MREYNAESPKKGRKRFNYNVKTIDFDHLVIIYLCWVGKCLEDVGGVLSVLLLIYILWFDFIVLVLSFRKEM